jgi:hypothetical protein
VNASFPIQSRGQHHPSRAIAQILRVQGAQTLHLPLERHARHARTHRHPVRAALAAPHPNLTAREIEVLDP